MEKSKSYKEKGVSQWDWFDFANDILDNGDKKDLLELRRQCLELTKSSLENKNPELKDKFVNGFLGLIKIIDKKIHGKHK